MEPNLGWACKEGELGGKKGREEGREGRGRFYPGDTPDCAVVAGRLWMLVVGWVGRGFGKGRGDVPAQCFY